MKLYLMIAILFFIGALGLNLYIFSENEYREDAVEGLSGSDSLELPPGKMFFPNPDGTVQIVDIDLYDQSTHNYETGSYSVGERNFAPDYEHTGFMSQLGSTNVQNPDDKTPTYLTGAKVVNTDDILGGFCKQYANDPHKLEEMCRRVDPDSCASTDCCALLGGQRCVSSDESGPIMKSNYSDYLITNRDFYYYRGKCYGNCN